ncbi:MAG TPA: HEPN domain-containing protein [Candidatus Lachnoclostridium pullistercoris]|uniref:HEPN domain-containing protein n=1 Tax=Candidatus Lachnoclostridium pullistercoris TaxID=2838632 RepID=A0A9D2T797_9FIRM|nr:HEPN domain-containing protein [Candidatus Lachnoclostridium pullistercoris]
MQLNLDDIGGARELARYRISAAKDDLEAAELNFKEGHYRSSNNRAYYAVFRAISACLALEFKAYKQHAQVIGNFNRDFVHTGIFPKEISRKISRAQEVRHASDYDDFYIVSIEDAKEQLETAKEVVELVEKYLNALDEK